MRDGSHTSSAATALAAEPGEAVPSGPCKVYGYDRLSYEDYFVGAFDTEAEARKVVRERLEHLARVQDAWLRGDLRVQPPGSRYRASLEDRKHGARWPHDG